MRRTRHEGLTVVPTPTIFQWKGAVMLILGMEAVVEWMLEGSDRPGYLGCGRVAFPCAHVATSHALNTH
jgi:hypothetical protein